MVTERPQSPRTKEPAGAGSQLGKGVNWGVMSIVLVVCFNTVSPLLREATKGARGEDFRMNPNSVMFLEEVLKYLITLGCLVFVELQGRMGGDVREGPKGNRRARWFGLQDLLGILQIDSESARAYLPFAIPAFLYSIQGALLWACLRYMDPASYQLMNNVKLFMTGTMQHVFLGQRLTVRKQQALVGLGIGILLGQWTGSTVGKLWQLSPKAYALSLMCSLVSSTSSITLKYLYKERSSFNEGNMWMYGFGAFFRFFPLVKSVGGLSGLHTMLDGFDSVVFLMLLVSTGAHLFTAAVVRFHSPLTKSFCTATAMPTTALLSFVLFHQTRSLQYIVSLPVVCFSIVRYATSGDGALESSWKTLP